MQCKEYRHEMVRDGAETGTGGRVTINGAPMTS